MSVRISQILLCLHYSICSRAAGKSPKECEAALTTQASRLDYEVSESRRNLPSPARENHGLPELDSSRRAPFIEDTLNLKADILNTIGDLLPYVLRNAANEDKKVRALTSIYEMLDTIGIPPKIFGLKINKIAS